ncbi:MAG: hypothetical protein KIH01_00700 [Candidatus Freyarchaeota archaeon]|nr:hypothetical protein [Candidatus Jordarchaeia archaeon]
MMKCENCTLVIDRDVAAVLNLWVWGAGFPPKALDELEREELSRNESSKYLHIPT